MTPSHDFKSLTTGQRIRHVRESLGFERNTFGILLGTEHKVVVAWEEDKRPLIEGHLLLNFRGVLQVREEFLLKGMGMPWRSEAHRKRVKAHAIKILQSGNMGCAVFNGQYIYQDLMRLNDREFFAAMDYVRNLARGRHKSQKSTAKKPVKSIFEAPMNNSKGTYI